MNVYKRLVLTNVRSFRRKKHDLSAKFTFFSFLICVAKLSLLMPQYILTISTLKVDLTSLIEESVVYVSEMLTFEVSNLVIELRYFIMRSIMM